MPPGERTNREKRQRWREKSPEERKAAVRRLEAAYEALDDDYAERILHGGPWEEDEDYSRANTEVNLAYDEVPFRHTIGPDFRRGRDRDNWPPR